MACVDLDGSGHFRARNQLVTSPADEGKDLPVQDGKYTSNSDVEIVEEIAVAGQEDGQLALGAVTAIINKGALCGHLGVMWRRISAG
jgi:hypothetical protein